MNERPIMFSAPMVRALLAGTKTQTRRVISNPHRNDEGFVMQDYGKGWWPYRSHDGESGFYLDRQKDGDYYSEATLRCPYGRPGDRLWVRESWSPDPIADGTWAYAAWAGCKDGQIAGVPERFRHPRFCNYAADWLHGPIRWTPSIHMPRWASRITLEVTGVRVERLQDISEADLSAEGIQEIIDSGVDHDGWPRDAYRHLWESINGHGSWDANPWVWVVEFRRLP